MFGYYLFISSQELILVFLAVLLLFGAKQIPEFARLLGKGMNEFRKATDDIKREFTENTGDFAKDLKESRDEISREIKDLGKAVIETDKNTESIKPEASVQADNKEPKQI